MHFAVGCTPASRPLELTGSGAITSPNYPNNYLTKSDCQYRLISVDETKVSYLQTLSYTVVFISFTQIEITV